MMIELLNKEELILLNKKLKYPLAIAEKDYFLALVLKIIFNSSLKDKLIFKGGTALYHLYLPQFRFSEDLDFSSNETEIKLEEVKNIFSDFDFLNIKKDYTSRATVKIEKLQYTGSLGQSNSLKVEIDFLQNVVLPPLEIEYQNMYGVGVTVRAMDIREISAEKIRAMNDRVRYRDFYDFAMIAKKLSIDFKEVLELVKKKEIRLPISKQNILNNFDLAKKEQQEDNLSICYTEKVSDDEVKKILDSLDFDIIQ